MNKPKLGLIIIGLLGIVLGACFSASPSIQSVDPNAVYTLAASTVIAEITRVARENKTPTPEITETPQPTPTVEIGTRLNPVPFGMANAMMIEDDLIFTLAITKVIRGQEAYNIIYSANMFNEAPPAGQEYILCYGVVNYLSSGNPEKILELSDANFKSVSNNQIIEYPWLVMPQPEFDLKLFPGGTGEGYFALLVQQGDPAPLISFGTNMYDDANRIYFAQ